MHPSHAPFLAAIRAAPDDDGPRLVFADWLEIDGPEDQRDAARVGLRERDRDIAERRPHQQFHPSDRNR